MAITYKSAGVDVTKIKQSQAAIGKIISATHTDGVGTKVMIANMMKKYDTVGIDCVAMNVNDIICVGATPISFVDFIAANKNDQKIFKKIVEGLAKGAKKAGVPIVGGETAIMPDLIAGKGFEYFLIVF